MKISDLELFLVEIPRSGLLPPVRSLLVRLGTDSGMEGWGEGWVAWRASELTPRRDMLLTVLAGRSIFDTEEVQTLEALASPPLRAAVEMACWDLVGRTVEQPLCRLLGGEYRRQIPLAARLTSRWPDRLAQLARETAGQGFHTQILSASADPEVDGQAVLAVREAIGDRVALRVDGQAAYPLDQARDLCTRIESHPIEFLLDPLATHELYPIASLGRQTTVPLAVGREIRSAKDVLAAARCGAARHVILDPEQLGGIWPSRACAAVARAGELSASLAGRPCLGVATAAMLHLAAATPSLSEANETAYHQLQDDVLVEPLEMLGGMMAVPQGPGLGIEIDRAQVDRYAVG